jgi:hypothetical protein
LLLAAPISAISGFTSTNGSLVNGLEEAEADHGQDHAL